MECDEVLLFERATFLIISFCERIRHRDGHRFEKVSNIIKGFKLSCRFVYLLRITHYPFIIFETTKIFLIDVKTKANQVLID